MVLGPSKLSRMRPHPPPPLLWCGDWSVRVNYFTRPGSWGHDCGVSAPSVHHAPCTVHCWDGGLVVNDHPRMLCQGYKSIHPSPPSCSLALIVLRFSLESIVCVLSSAPCSLARAGGRGGLCFDLDRRFDGTATGLWGYSASLKRTY